MRSTTLAPCGRCFFQGRELHIDPRCDEHREPILLVEHVSNELIAEWQGRELEIGQTVVVTEMDTDDNRVSCRILSISDDTARVEITQGRLLVIDPGDETDWPFSGQPTGYRDDPSEPGPTIKP